MQSFLSRLAPVWAPHEGQRQFLLNQSKIKVLACGRRWGKTDACAAQIVAALHQDSPTRHLIIAPTLDQARLLFERVRRMFEELLVAEQRTAPIPVKVTTSPYPRLTFGKHTVVARSGHLGRSLRGNEATHIVVDEAAYVPEELVTEVAMPMLATSNGTLTLISTPHGMNHFWRFFEMGRRGEHGVWSRTAPTAEAPHVNPGFLEAQRELISPRAFSVEYEASFLDAAGRVFPTDAVERCLVPQFVEPISGPFCIGVDWGRYTDFTAVTVLAGRRQSAKLVELHRFNGLPWREQVSRVAEVVRRYPHSRVLVDATGSGDPLHEALQEKTPEAGIERVVFTQAVKAGLIDNLAWMVSSASLTMTPHVELLREMQHFEAKPSAHGGSKFSAPSGFHDDLVIALALAAQGLAAEYRAPILLGEERRFG